MKSQLTDDFITYFRALPVEVRMHARKNYQLWKHNPYHPSLHFKRVHAHEPLYSIRIGLGWRALGLLEADLITWFWIGSHAEYDRLIQ
ncbi:MAG: hypothetical protein M3R24_12895 [Chloroflexota bacterium]|nr:hypothetical protein [Chloroflexota bacterium]